MSVERLIGMCSLFLVTQLLGGFAYGQLGLEADIFTVFFQHAETVPMIILTFGPALQAAVLGAGLLWLRQPAQTGRRFVRFVFTEWSTPQEARLWEYLSFGLMVVLPGAVLGWAWLRFISRGKAWYDVGPVDQAVGLWSRHPDCFLFGTLNNCRFGVPGTQIADSFAPFWQPVLIMVPFCILAFGLSVALLMRLLRSSA